MNEKPRHLDLFSGIGGFSLGLEAAGFRTIGFSEIEPRACEVLKKNFPEVENFGDASLVPWLPCEIITGGFPCQPFSISGHRRGKQDPRYLWHLMFAIVKKCKPDWVIGENVIGFRDVGLDEVLHDLETEGYSCRTFSVPACAVGLPTHRHRLWIVANHHEIGRSRAQLGNMENKTNTVHNQRTGEGASIQSARAVGSEANVAPTFWSRINARGCRNIDGIPHRLDRYGLIGNAVVPAIVEKIGRSIYNISYENILRTNPPN